MSDEGKTQGRGKRKGRHREGQQFEIKTPEHYASVPVSWGSPAWMQICASGSAEIMNLETLPEVLIGLVELLPTSLSGDLCEIACGEVLDTPAILSYTVRHRYHSMHVWSDSTWQPILFAA